MATADAASLVGYLSTATGGLFGGASLINPSTGVDYTYDAVALDGWDATVGGQPSNSVSPTPSLVTGSSTTSIVLFNGAVKMAVWGGPNASRDAVSAAMMRNNVMNEFVLDSATQSGTDWVVTFPTKRFYVTGATASSRQPFTNAFSAAGSCDVVRLDATALASWGVFSREEQFEPDPQNAFGFSVGGSRSLCWGANVITFNNATGASTIFGSKNLVSRFTTSSQDSYVSYIGTSFKNGWMKLGLLQSTMALNPIASSTNGVLDATPQSYYGLPVIGFMAQNFVNSLISSFGGNFVHKYSLDIR